MDNNQTNNKQGKWIIFSKGDEKALANLLVGKKTGWIVEDENRARDCLEKADIHIYFTKDEEGKYTVPRIIVGEEYNKITDIGGVAKHRDVEPDMLGVLKKKMDELPYSKRYEKVLKDMMILSKIYNKYKNNEELTKEEIYFIYQITSGIESFSYAEGNDPRIKEILASRNIKDDGYKYFWDLVEIKGDADFSRVENICLPNLKEIERHAYFNNLRSAEGLPNLEKIGGNANFNSLETDAGLQKLQVIGGEACFSKLEKLEALQGIKSIKSASFENLKSAKGLENIKELLWNADFRSLKTAEGLENLENIRGTASFDCLENAESLKNLKLIDGDAFFDNLKSAKGLENLESIKGNAFFDDLESVKGLENLKSIEGDACFYHLENPKELENLEYIGRLDLNNREWEEELEEILEKNNKGKEHIKREEPAKKSVNTNVDKELLKKQKKEMLEAKKQQLLEELRKQVREQKRKQEEDKPKKR